MHTPRFSGPVWSLFRIVIGLLFSLHGAATVLGLFGGNQGSGEAIPAGTWPSWWAGLIQLVCGLLVLVGLFTRTAALLASGSMAYAYFTVHQPKALFPLQNGGDAPALFCWTFLAIAVLGAGPLSLDAIWRRRTSPNDAGANVTAVNVAGATTMSPNGSGATVPGAKVPGATVPSATVPSAKVPGAKVPGATVPSATVPSANVPDATATSLNVPSPNVPSPNLTGADPIEPSPSPAGANPDAAGTPGTNAATTPEPKAETEPASA